MADIARLTVVYESQGYKTVQAQMNKLKRDGAALGGELVRVGVASEKAATSTTSLGHSAKSASVAMSSATAKLLKWVAGLQAANEKFMRTNSELLVAMKGYDQLSAAQARNARTTAAVADSRARVAALFKATLAPMEQYRQNLRDISVLQKTETVTAGQAATARSNANASLRAAIGVAERYETEQARINRLLELARAAYREGALSVNQYKGRVAELTGQLAGLAAAQREAARSAAGVGGTGRAAAVARVNQRSSAGTALASGAINQPEYAAVVRELRAADAATAGLTSRQRRLGTLLAQNRRRLVGVGTEGATAMNKVAAGVTRVEARMTGLGGAIRGLGNVFKHAFGGLIAFGVVAAIAQFSRSIITGNRDLQKMLNTLNAASGSMSLAKREFKFLADVADRLGTDLQGSADGYSRLAISARSAGISTAQLHKSFLGLSEGFAATGRSGDEMNRFLVQLEQGLSQGTIHMRDLRAMAQSFPAAFDIAGEAAKRMGGSLQDFLKNGGLPAKEFFTAFSDVTHERFEAAAKAAGNTLIGQMNRIYNALFKAKSGAGVLAPLTQAFKELADQLRSEEGSSNVRELAANIVVGFRAALKAIVLLIKFLPELIALVKLLATVIVTRLVIGGVLRAVAAFGKLTFAIKEFMAVSAVSGMSSAVGGLGKRVAAMAVGTSIATRLGIGAAAAGASGAAAAGIGATGAAAAAASLPLLALVAVLGGVAYAAYKVGERVAEQAAQFRASIKNTTDAAKAIDEVTKSTNSLASAASFGGASFSQMAGQVQNNAAAIADAHIKEAAAALVLAKAEAGLEAARHPNMANRRARETGNRAAIIATTQKVRIAQSAFDELKRSTDSLESANTDLSVQMSSQLSPALVEAYNKANPPQSFFGGMTSSADTLIGRLRELIGLQNQVDNKSLAQLALEGKGFSSYSAPKQLTVLEDRAGSFIVGLEKAYGDRNQDSNVSRLNALLAQAQVAAKQFPDNAAVADHLANTKKLVASHIEMAKALDAESVSRTKQIPPTMSQADALSGLTQEYKRLVSASSGLTKEQAALAQEHDKLNRLGDEAIDNGAKLATVTAMKSKALEQFNKNQSDALALQLALNAANQKQYEDGLRREIQLRAAQGLLSNRQDQMGPLQFQQQQSLLGIRQHYQQEIAQIRQQQANALLQPDADAGQINSQSNAQVRAQQVAQTAALNVEQGLYNDKLEQMQRILPGIKGGFQTFAAEALNLTGQMNQAVSKFLIGFSDGLATVMTGGKFSFKELLRSFLQMIAQMITRWLVFRAITSIGKKFGVDLMGTGDGNKAEAMMEASDKMMKAGLVVGISAYFMKQSAEKLQEAATTLLAANVVGMFAANGAAFGTGGNVIPFANGGVVNSPTLFEFASGTGLMGEAGPEAIMPLTRGPDGKLGVQSHGGSKEGGGRPITISYNIDARGAGPDEVAKLAQMRVETIKKVHSDVVHYDKYGYFPSAA